MNNSSNRNHLISLIHAQKNAAHLDDTSYRAIVFGATGNESCSECTGQQLKAVFDDLNIVLEKQNKRPFRFYRKKEKPVMLDAVIARAKKTLGNDWKNRLDGFCQSKLSKQHYTDCDQNELRRIMAFLSRVGKEEK